MWNTQAQEGPRRRQAAATSGGSLDMTSSATATGGKGGDALDSFSGVAGHGGDAEAHASATSSGVS